MKSEGWLNNCQTVSGVRCTAHRQGDYRQSGNNEDREEFAWVRVILLLLLCRAMIIIIKTALMTPQ
jgi:hypothetical protein